MTDTALALLPVPSVIEELDHEGDLQRRKDKLVELYPPIEEYIDLEFEPSVGLLEESTYTEILFRNRVNKTYLSRLLYFATGADLDHVAEESGVTRLEGEPDADLRQRTRISNRGSSAAGPDDWWRDKAMGADERVEDVAVARVPVGPDNEPRGLIRLSILAQTADGIPSQEILDNVIARVARTDVRVLGSTPEVVPATSQTVDVSANIWLLPDALPGTFEGLEAALVTAFAQSRALGFDITPSWLTSILHRPGVQRVELSTPTAPTIVDFDAAPVLGAVSLTLMGIDH